MIDSNLRLTTSETKRLLLLAATVSICSTQFSMADDDTWSTPKAVSAGEIVLQVAAAEGEDPYLAGVEAATALKKKMGDSPPQAVILSECFRSFPWKIVPG